MDKDARWQVLHGNCLEVLKTLPSNSIDAVVTDPPYGLSEHSDIQTMVRYWFVGKEFVNKSAGFMGKDWDSFVPGPEIWREVKRVLKPGGHVLAFAGSRTIDLMGISLRFAGLEIRDSIMCWLYSGFPKSMNVGKAVDALVLTGGSDSKSIKQANALRPGEAREAAFLPVNGIKSTASSGSNLVNDNPATEEGLQWDGWGTALKPAFEPVLVAQKPFDVPVAENVLTHGTGALNIDANRMPAGSAEPEQDTNSKGRWPPNVLLTHHPECAEEGDCHPDCGVKRIDAQSEGVSRFFPQFRYNAKVSRAERHAGMGEPRNNHPTVKPSGVMRWLIRLVAPQGGVVLDPFNGSGSTGIAAMKEGMRYVGIEREAEYVEISKARIAHAAAETEAKPFPNLKPPKEIAVVAPLTEPLPVPEGQERSTRSLDPALFKKLVAKGLKKR